MHSESSLQASKAIQKERFHQGTCLDVWTIPTVPTILTKDPIPGPSTGVFFLPFGETAQISVVCRQKRRFISKVPFRCFYKGYQTSSWQKSRRLVGKSRGFKTLTYHRKHGNAKSASVQNSWRLLEKAVLIEKAEKRHTYEDPGISLTLIPNLRWLGEVEEKLFRLLLLAGCAPAIPTIPTKDPISLTLIPN